MKPSSPSDSKNIEIIDLDSTPRVFRPTDALQFVVEKIGFDKVMNGTIRHMGAKLLIRRPFKINLNTFKKVDEDLYLNRKGTAVDKFRTITILNSVHRLNLSISLTTEPPTKITRAAKVKPAKTTRAPRAVKKEMRQEPEERIALIPQPVVEALAIQPIMKMQSEDFVYGSEGVLNLFDD